MRYFLEIAYRGTNYHGWQVQKNAVTVQEVIDQKLEILLRTKVETVGSGRTDTGVHALQQFIHFDAEFIEDKDKWLYQINRLLPWDIVAKKLWVVKPDAHARFDAISRSYQYRMSLVKDPFLEGMYYQYKRPLDIEKMNEAAKIILQTDDFQSFCKVHTDVGNFFCKIYQAEWMMQNEMLIFFVSANRFLRGMVRALTGTMLEIGKGNISIEELREIILSRDRRNAGMALPACGLFLTRVEYPADILNIILD